MYQLSSTLSNPEPAAQEAAPFKVIVFTVGKQLLALPLSQGNQAPFPVVQKVINCPPIFDSSSANIGLVHWEQREITVLRLHAYLAQPLENNQFLVLIQTPTGDLYGIPVEEPPSLMELPANTIRALPPSYRQLDPLGVSSYIAVLPQDPQPVTIFLLDLNRALKTLTTASNTANPLLQ